MTDQARLPDHIAETVGQLADLQAAHRDNVSGSENIVRQIIQRIGRPIALASFLTFVAVWIIGNIIAAHLGVTIDPPPFGYLDLSSALISVSLTILILITQQRDDALAERREQMTLELALIADRRGAKIIALLEELRRDLPQVTNHNDSEADEMAEPNAPRDILDAIKDSHGKPATGVTEPGLDKAD